MASETVLPDERCTDTDGQAQEIKKDLKFKEDEPTIPKPAPLTPVNRPSVVTQPTAASNSPRKLSDGSKHTLLSASPSLHEQQIVVKVITDAPTPPSSWKLLLAFLGLVVVLVMYVNLGATVMMMLESTGDREVEGPQKAMRNVVKQIMRERNSTEHELEVLLTKFQYVVVETVAKGWVRGENKTILIDEWTYAASLLYCASLVTTVGYGNIVPTTSLGRLFTVAYSLFGVPLCLICISIVGVILARLFRLLIKLLVKDSVDPEDGTVYVPLWVSLAIMFAYLSVGSGLFTVLSKGEWSYLEAFYFCFITLSTIGLGDYVYGYDSDIELTKEEMAHKSSSLLASVIYLIVGLSLMSMCFSLMQEEVARKLRKTFAYIKVCLKRCFDNCLRVICCFDLCCPKKH